MDVPVSFFLGVGGDKGGTRETFWGFKHIWNNGAQMNHQILSNFNTFEIILEEN